MDASNLLKPALARGSLRCIGATTLNEYKLCVFSRGGAGNGGGERSERGRTVHRQERVGGGNPPAAKRVAGGETPPPPPPPQPLTLPPSALSQICGEGQGSRAPLPESRHL
jgi:hypothetical protein